MKVHLQDILCDYTFYIIATDHLDSLYDPWWIGCTRYLAIVKQAIGKSNIWNFKIRDSCHFKQQSSYHISRIIAWWVLYQGDLLKRTLLVYINWHFWVGKKPICLQYR